MVVELSTSHGREHSPDFLRKLVKKHLLRITLEALIEAEWGHIRETLLQALPDNNGSSDYALNHKTRKIQTELGNIKVKIPDHSQIKFKSKLLDQRQRKICVGIEEILRLAFLDRKKLVFALENLFDQDLSNEFANRFHEALSERLYAGQNTETADSPRCASFAGIWESLGIDELGWVEICSELGSSDLTVAGKVLKNNSPDIEICSQEFTDSFIDPLADTIEFTSVEISSIIETESVPSPEISSKLRQDISGDLFSPLPTESRSGSSAFAGALIALLVLVTGFYYLANEISAQHMRTSAKRIGMKDMEAVFNERAANSESAPQPQARMTRAHFDYSPSAVLASMSHDPDYHVRIQLTKTLSLAGDAISDDGLRTVIQLLSDQDYLVRGFAAKALGKIDSPLAREALIEQKLVEDNSVVLLVINQILK